jgi:hypothetical protein
MIWRAVLRLSKTMPKQRKAPVLLFATGLTEICALLSNGPAIGSETSA